MQYNGCKSDNIWVPLAYLKVRRLDHFSFRYLKNDVLGIPNCEVLLYADDLKMCSSMNSCTTVEHYKVKLMHCMIGAFVLERVKLSMSYSK